MQIVYGVENTEIGTENILILTYQTIKVGFLMIHANKKLLKRYRKNSRQIKFCFGWIYLDTLLISRNL